MFYQKLAKTKIILRLLRSTVKIPIDDLFMQEKNSTDWTLINEVKEEFV